MKYTNEVVINQPIDKVVALFSDPENLKEWQPGFESIELVSGQEGAPGAVSRLKYNMGKRHMELLETIKVNDLPENFTATFETKGVYYHQVTKFQSIGEQQTRYIADNEFKFKGIAKLYGILMPGAFKKQTQKYLDSFKAFAERS